MEPDFIPFYYNTFLRCEIETISVSNWLWLEISERIQLARLKDSSGFFCFFYSLSYHGNWTMLRMIFFRPTCDLVRGTGSDSLGEMSVICVVYSFCSFACSLIELKTWRKTVRFWVQLIQVFSSLYHTGMVIYYSTKSFTETHWVMLKEMTVLALLLRKDLVGRLSIPHATL